MSTDLDGFLPTPKGTPTLGDIVKVPPLNLNKYDAFDSDEEDFDVMSIPAPVSLTAKGSVRTTSTNFIFGYEYACRYLVTAHLGKNTPFSPEKVYDKEFVVRVNQSIVKRDDPRLHYDKNDKSLLCNKLQIHAVKSMRDHKFSKGGSLKNSVFVRVFTKKERDAIKDSEMPREMLMWMGKIQRAFVETRFTYEPQLTVYGVIGRADAKNRPLDKILPDSDVALYAKAMHRKLFNDGTLIDRPDIIRKFYSKENAVAAAELLG